MDKIKNFLNRSKTLRYWGVVGKLAFWSAAPISKVWDKMIEIGLSFFVAAAFLGVYGRIVDPSLIYINATWIAWWVAATFVGRLIVGLVYQPAKLPKELGRFIENPFEVSIVNPDQNFSQDDVKWVNIKVNNKSSIANIEGCYLELSHVVDLQTNQPLALGTQRLRWGDRDLEHDQGRNQAITINYDSPRWCDVATANRTDHTASYVVSYLLICQQVA